MSASLGDRLAKALGAKIAKSRALPGGDIADVSLLTLTDGQQLVAKRPRADRPDTTEVEAFMLSHLKEKSPLPIPAVRFQEAGIMVMDYIPHAGLGNARAAAQHVADQVAQLHRVRPSTETPYYGFEKDTVIGPLPQVNKAMDNWCSFFTENRLMTMAHSCANTNRFDGTMMKRLENLAAKLPDMLPATPESSLLHGDLWAGNMLIDDDKVVGFIDPAISYGHREMDIAFMLMMGGLDPSFLPSYDNAYALEPDFDKERVHIYQLWPLLVHLRLFGGGYLQSVSNILDRLGA